MGGMCQGAICCGDPNEFQTSGDRPGDRDQLSRKDAKDLLNHAKKNEEKVVKIQSWARGHKVRKEVAQ